jgi:hypothetical protein
MRVNGRGSEEERESHSADRMYRLYNPVKIPVTFRIRLVALIGILFCVLGVAAVILTIIDLARGRPHEFHYDESQGGLQVENPLWPSAGKSLRLDPSY